MADSQLQVALRELRDHIWNIRTLSVLALIGAVLTLVSPFGTDRALDVGARAAFWIGVVIGTYAVGMTADLLVRPHCKTLPAPLRVTLIATVTGLVTGIAVELVTNVIFGWPSTWAEVPGEFAPKFAIGVAASLGIQISGGFAPPPATDPVTPATPPLLDRLPLDKRGPLVALSVEDHYVRIRTTRGETMLLMRLSDAIRETDPTPGLRVHRSHWVATDQVTATRRDGDRAILSLSHGGDIPASRSHIDALKQAGLLPR